MAKNIFISLPVKDLKRSIAFFTALGYSFNPQFSDETATCMIISDSIYVMMATHEKFEFLSPKPVCDTSKYNEALLCLSCESREEVDALMEKAVANGATAHGEAQDHGFMYDHGFVDLDGHAWGLMYMEPSMLVKA